MLALLAYGRALSWLRSAGYVGDAATVQYVFAAFRPAIFVTSGVHETELTRPTARALTTSRHGSGSFRPRRWLVYREAVSVLRSDTIEPSVAFDGSSKPRRSIDQSKQVSALVEVEGPSDCSTSGSTAEIQPRHRPLTVSVNATGDEDEEADEEETDAPVHGRVRKIREEERYDARRDERPSNRRSNCHVSLSRLPSYWLLTRFDRSAGSPFQTIHHRVAFRRSISDGRRVPTLRPS